MIALLRALVRLLSFVLLVALAAAGAAAAVFSIQGDGRTLGLKHLGQILHLPQARDWVAGLLRALEAPGPVAVLALVCGAGAILLGFALLAGLLGRARPRIIALETSGDGRIAARRRALAQAVSELADGAEGVTAVKARVVPRRTRDGGRAKVRATRVPTMPAASVRSAVDAALRPLTEAWPVQPKVAARAGRGEDRVQ